MPPRTGSDVLGALTTTGQQSILPKRLILSERRYYDALRTAVELDGGEMRHKRKGYPVGGAWIVDYKGRRSTFAFKDGFFTSFDDRHTLDQFYVPKKPSPKSWRDYLCTLVADALEKWRGLYMRGCDTEHP